MDELFVNDSRQYILKKTRLYEDEENRFGERPDQMLEVMRDSAFSAQSYWRVFQNKERYMVFGVT